ncbi:MAG: peptidoglycan DD-metalloendopeptidase family protein [Rhodospirillaceae bacterium]|nr:peptidoglycan DD-metalloendopeptidase family protein [Rhodospirillaceae bacterium]
MPRSDALTAAFAGLVIATAPALQSWATDAPDPAQLKALERNLEETTAARDKLRGESVGNARDVEAIRTDLIQTAKEIQDQEHSLTIMENRIRDLERDSARMGAALVQRDAQMTQVLMALERLALRPTDALSLSPLAPADAVRTAILLRAALPHIKQSEASLHQELSGLYALRADVQQQKEAAAAAAAALLAKHAKLETLEREKAARQVQLASRSEELDTRLAKMAREAQDLRDLFAKLAEEKAARDKAAAEKAKAEEAARAAEAAKAAKAKPAEPQAPPAPTHDVAVTRSFAKARGTMPFPVTGTLATRYGAAGGSAEDPSSRAKGITITTRGGAQVVAPFDGIVAFAGPFRGYGQLLIIEHSEGYHTLLAGMGRIDAVVGARVLAGEPVGVMENASTTAGEKTGGPSLYVELRRDGQPINPLPWLASAAGKSSG